MKTSYALPLWHHLDISIDLFLQEVNYGLINFTELSEWNKIREWVKLIYIWRHHNLGYGLTHQQLTGIYGELFAAGLLIKNKHYFEEWIFTAAIQEKRRGSNTNKDLKAHWIGKGVIRNLEVKTIGKEKAKIWGSDEKKAYVIPDGLIAVKEINETTYYIHSMTTKKDLEKICERVRQAHLTYTRYVFDLEKLNTIKWKNSCKFLEYKMDLDESIKSLMAS